MAKKKNSRELDELQVSLLDDKSFLKGIIESFCQRLVQEEITHHLQAKAYQRTDKRRGYRNGYKPRGLKTRVGKLELLLPQDREGEFQAELFRRYQRSEKALVVSLMEMYLNGVSTRKVTNILEEEVEETLSCFHFPFSYRKRIRTTNSLERFNEEIRRRTRVIRIFPNEESYIRLVSALAIEQSEEGLTGTRYLNMKEFYEGENQILKVELVDSDVGAVAIST